MTPKLTKAQATHLLYIYANEEAQTTPYMNLRVDTCYALEKKGVITRRWNHFTDIYEVTEAGRKVCEGLKK